MWTVNTNVKKICVVLTIVIVLLGLYLNHLAFFVGLCVSGKGPSIWDTFCHEGRVLNGDTGDVACNSYHQYDDDIKLIKSLGVSFTYFEIY